MKWLCKIYLLLLSVFYCVFPSDILDVFQPDSYENEGGASSASKRIEYAVANLPDEKIKELDNYLHEGEKDAKVLLDEAKREGIANRRDYVEDMIEEIDDEVDRITKLHLNFWIRRFTDRINDVFKCKLNQKRNQQIDSQKKIQEWKAAFYRIFTVLKECNKEREKWVKRLEQLKKEKQSSASSNRASYQAPDNENLTHEERMKKIEEEYAQKIEEHDQKMKQLQEESDRKQKEHEEKIKQIKEETEQLRRARIALEKQSDGGVEEILGSLRTKVENLFSGILPEQETVVQDSEKDLPSAPAWWQRMIFAITTILSTSASSQSSSAVSSPDESTNGSWAVSEENRQQDVAQDIDRSVDNKTSFSPVSYDEPCVSDEKASDEETQHNEKEEESRSRGLPWRFFNHQVSAQEYKESYLLGPS